MTDIQMDIEDDFLEESEPREDESDLEKVLLNDLSNSIVQSTDWTTDTLIGQIEKERIQLDPSFQRRDAWTAARKSQLIESLILGFPVPQIVLAESRDQRGRYLVIDGKQRLLSLVQYAGSSDLKEKFGSYNLQGLKILDQLNGTSYSDLRSDGNMSESFEEFENRTIRTVVIRHWEHEAVLYHIFLRLNTGSVQLSPQELRNALHPGPFAQFLDECSAESPALRRILKRDEPDFRMRDAELLLRFYAFKNYIGDYAGSMKSFLDATSEQFNRRWGAEESDIRAQASDFEEAVSLVYEVFGDDAFRKWKDGEFSGRFNRAVFDIMVYYFSIAGLREAIGQRGKEIKRAYIELSKSSPEFVSSVESTTKSLGATMTRFSRWAMTLNKVLGARVSVPELIKNRIRI